MKSDLKRLATTWKELFFSSFTKPLIENIVNAKHCRETWFILIFIKEFKLKTGSRGVRVYKELVDPEGDHLFWLQQRKSMWYSIFNILNAVKTMILHKNGNNFDIVSMNKDWRPAKKIYWNKSIKMCYTSSNFQMYYCTSPWHTIWNLFWKLHIFTNE